MKKIKNDSNKEQIVNWIWKRWPKETKEVSESDYNILKNNPNFVEISEIVKKENIEEGTNNIKHHENSKKKKK